MISLLALVVILAGFLLGVQPLLVIVVAAFVAGLGAHIAPLAILALLGKAYNANRFILAIYLILPVVGLLERRGLQAKARALVVDLRGATLGRLLAAYMLFRQISAGLGLISIAGHPQTVRPLLAPMAEAAAERAGPLDDAGRDRVRALAAATDNLGLLFGEDIFLAIGSILLMRGILLQYGITVEPLAMSLWAMPVAVAAFLIHGARLACMGRRQGKKDAAA
jgi:uncharacterized membrane protein